MTLPTDQLSRFKKRSFKLLKMLQGKVVSLEPSSKQGVLLLAIEGERRIKCENEIVASWFRSGYVQHGSAPSDRSKQRIRLSAEGIAFLKRAEDNEYANQHRENIAATVTVSQIKQIVTRNIKESPLSALFHQNSNRKAWLNESQFDAGERLRADFEFSQLSPRITSSWDPNANLGKKGGNRAPGENLSDRAIDARRRLNNAIEAVGPEFSTILLDVCCFLKGMEQIERERQWPRRSAKLLLRLALSALARHYDPQKHRPNPTDIRHWGTDDFRPKIGFS